MSKEEFVKFIESIGFNHNGHNGHYYLYKEYSIYLFLKHYGFHNGSEWVYNIKLNDLTPLKQIIRSIKLKQLLR